MRGLDRVVRLKRGGGLDAYGDPIPPGPDDAEVEYTGCLVWPGNAGSGQEPYVPGREPVIADRVCSLPPGADIRSTDRLTIRGKDYDVIGEPFDWVNPRTGRSKGVIVYANRGEG